ncbi:hypothetical protein IT072_15785 [Leifsonia sp. ZF2019]|uniref:hypothetical protein n=1 Tax=Leifsonia sp. ZF2019 TaxID=2781978 RepID=UPI001CC1BF4F|nr:hypothetical protein [Leifsonia sp. ZF2019]UAJ78682.1 hypothetical protein IT072_15785 [Leifsonia sp. ZF2019]
MPVAESAPPTDRWREPASLLPLRWGSYRPRLAVALAMLVVGSACVLATTAYSLPLLLVGSLLQPAAWAVVPSTIGRRVAVALPVLGFTWLMLGGSSFAWCYAVTLAAWLLVRLRPLVSFAVLLLPLASSLVLPLFVTTYEQGWITIVTSTVVIVAAAWVARGIAVRWDSRRSVRTLRNSTD